MSTLHYAVLERLFQVEAFDQNILFILKQKALKVTTYS